MISMVLRKLPLPAKKNTLSSTGNLRAKGRRRRRNRSRGGSVGSASPFHLLVCRHFLLIFLLFLSFGAAANSYIAHTNTHKDSIVCVCVLVSIVRRVWNFCRSRELAKHQLQLQIGTCTTQLTKYPFFKSHTKDYPLHTHRHTSRHTLPDTHAPHASTWIHSNAPLGH